MLEVLNLPKYHRQRVAAIASQKKDYSRYKFRFDAGALKAEHTEVVLVLLSVAEIIECSVVKQQIIEAIENAELKEWIIQDVLMEADETFFDKFTIAKTMKNIYSLDEPELVKSFAEIANTINY